MSRRLLAEFIGTAALLAAIVGSGIHAERLTDDVGLQLTINVIGTAGALTALILALGPRSGAHFNPAITLADLVLGGMTRVAAALYIGAQLVGAFGGVLIANLMFGLGAVEQSENIRTGGGVFLGEAVAMFGLVLVVFGVVRAGRSQIAAFTVGAYIAAAMLFTSSTSFANPAVTVARSITDSFTGIAWGDVPLFLGAQAVGLAVGIAAVLALYPHIGEVADEAVVPRQDLD